MVELQLVEMIIVYPVVNQAVQLLIEQVVMVVMVL